MHIVEIKLEGVRGFPSSGSAASLSLAHKDGTVPRWIVVAGRNGAGKSTFLQAIALAIAGPSVARLLAETFQGWIRDGEEHARAAVKLRFGDDDGFGSGRKPTFEPWAAMGWERADGPEPTITKAAVGGNWSPVRGPWAENPRGWFTAGYGPFRRLSPAPTEAQRLMMSPGRPAALASLFREDASLSESIVWLQQIYLRRLEGRPEAQAIEDLVLNLLDDGLLPEGMRVERVDSEGLWVRTPEDRHLALASLSDGYRTVAGLVLDLIKQLVSAFHTIIFDEDSDGHVRVIHEGVVLIDEIDVHLHIEWQKRIGFWLKDHFPRMQFIVTTHSPFICQAADEGGLIRLSPAWEHDSGAEILTGEDFNRVVNGSVDDAVLTDLFGLDSVLSDSARHVRQQLAELEATALTRELSPAQHKDLDTLRAKVPTSQADRALQRLVMHDRRNDE
ncbi:ATP-binding protein [Nocardia sp. NEAU-G5]|uniref:ATP-binding protein n=1 Tax=Nocardia albiluteola TaxID=2842303 RepID=A0ABS6AYK2_9NOCA|nr:ATP-binding protein [Nocardia albiluteola]MBU3063124.1 ATP-binding protein [Nocardia albiluteola]